MTVLIHAAWCPLSTAGQDAPEESGTERNAKAEDDTLPVTTDSPSTDSKATPEEKDGEVVVTATRTKEDPNDTPRGISSVDWKDLEKRGPSSSTPAELLKGEPGVFLQQTGRRGGAPIIRGMIGKYILPMYDGIRLTDGTIFAGPNGIFNNVDRFTISRIEVVRGPASLFYGSDALGGTINIVPKRYDGFPEEFDIGFGVQSHYRSVNNMFSERVEFMGGIRPINFYLGGTFIDAGDTRGGSGLGRSFNTSWTEFNFDARIGIQLAKGHVLEAAYFRNEVRNSFRYDQPWETPDRNAWWKAHESLYLTGSGLRKRMNRTPQAITQVASLTYSAENPTEFWDEVLAKFYWRGQYDQGERGSEQTSTRTVNKSVGHQNSYGLSAQFAWQMAKINKVVYGFDTRLDDVYAGRAWTIVYDKSTGERLSRSQDNTGSPSARYLDVGVFLYDELQPVECLTISGGIRYNYTNLTSRPTARTVPSPLQPDDLRLDTDFTSFTWQTGVVWDVIDELTIVANVGTGFKSPSISDTLSSGPFTFGVSAPSPDLDPEESITYEIGVKSRFDRFNGELLVYYTDLTNIIDSRPGFFGGSDFIDLNGNGTKDSDEQVYVKDNVGRAYIFGIEAAANWEFVRSDSLGSFYVGGHGSFTRGYDLTGEDNLRFIPPVNGLASVRWEMNTGSEFGSRYWAEIEVPWSFNKPKNRFSQDDFADLAQFPRKPGNLPGWVLINLRSGVDITDYASLSWSITNLLNSEYQSFGSRLPGDGFSFDVGLKIEW
ncbi:MAG: TonB-dependent receptor [Planctomycetes bacterium]|nr:TonB-dependent receptor [Planctomycetota bacterium]